MHPRGRALGRPSWSLPMKGHIPYLSKMALIMCIFVLRSFIFSVAFKTHIAKIHTLGLYKVTTTRRKMRGWKGRNTCLDGRCLLASHTRGRIEEGGALQAALHPLFRILFAQEQITLGPGVCVFIFTFTAGWACFCFHSASSVCAAVLRHTASDLSPLFQVCLNSYL